MKVEQELVLEITTRQQNIQADRKIEALIRGGWDIRGIDIYEIQDPETGQVRSFRQILIYGEPIQKGKFAGV